MVSRCSRTDNSRLWLLDRRIGAEHGFGERPWSSTRRDRGEPARAAHTLEPMSNEAESSDRVVTGPMDDRAAALLPEFLYEVIFQPEEGKRLPRTVIRQPELWRYIEGFGGRPGDCGMAAVIDGTVVGAAWSRPMRGYGYVDDGTPELAVALYPGYRGRGIGGRLLRALFAELRDRGFRSVSLSVQHANPAYALYRRLGFVEVRAMPDESIMTLRLAADDGVR